MTKRFRDGLSALVGSAQLERIRMCASVREISAVRVHLIRLPGGMLSGTENAIGCPILFHGVREASNKNNVSAEGDT